MSSLLIVSADKLGENMAGPAIRNTEIARALSRNHKVTLAAPGDDLPVLARQADVVMVSGFILQENPWLKSLGKPLVVDIYDPFFLENLEIHKAETLLVRNSRHAGDLGVQLELLAAGDYFICASERQRDFWLGMLAAMNRINPASYDASADARNLIDVVPFGIPEKAPEQTRQVLKGVVPGIREKDRVILWGGGIWNWFDPLTLIRAIGEIGETREDIKLFFMGVKSPNPDVPEMEMSRQAFALSDELGLTGRSIFFNDWVPYEERQNYLLEADLGISLHFDHLETKFSFRTRVLDCIWAALPVISTSGDSLSELIENNSLGLAVPPEDVGAVAEAILKLVEDKGFHSECRDSLHAIAPQYFWSEAVKPLDAFCARPVMALDKDMASDAGSLSGGAQAPKRSLSGKIASRLRRK